ncbi:hypothetical protein LMG28727_05544 [Paraburkholderia kirstenboschensis]|nr:hypothetical protein LMG28727_05544 [Paraburkholderia kirstenboschensis]
MAERINVLPEVSTRYTTTMPMYVFGLNPERWLCIGSVSSLMQGAANQP